MLPGISIPGCPASGAPPTVVTYLGYKEQDEIGLNTTHTFSNVDLSAFSGKYLVVGVVGTNGTANSINVSAATMDGVSALSRGNAGTNAALIGAALFQAPSSSTPDIVITSSLNAVRVAILCWSINDCTEQIVYDMQGDIFQDVSFRYEVPLIQFTASSKPQVIFSVMHYDNTNRTFSFSGSGTITTDVSLQQNDSTTSFAAAHSFLNGVGAFSTNSICTADTTVGSNAALFTWFIR